MLVGSENESEVTDDFFNNFLKPLKEAGKTIIILHHLRKANLDEVEDGDLQDTLRGSGDVVATLDLAFILRSSKVISSIPTLEVNECVLKDVKNRLGIPFRDLKGNRVDMICYRILRDTIKVSTVFEYVEPSEVKSPKTKRQDLMVDILREKGPLTRQQITKYIVPLVRCSENLIEKDLQELVKNEEIVREKFGSYSSRKTKNIEKKEDEQRLELPEYSG
jgi:hypothetical protein